MKACAFALAILLRPALAGAQAEIQTWMNREMGKQIPRGEFRYSLYPSQPVKNQPTDLENSEYSFNVLVPVAQDDRNEFTLSADVRYESLQTDAILPDTDQPLPNEVWYTLFGAGYRHRFENDWIGGLSVAAGSNSDEPFHSIDEMLFRAVGLLLVPQDERDAWIFSLIYSSDQEFFGVTFPVPGIAYLYNPSDDFRMVIGVPITSIEYKPLEKLTLEAQYFPVRRIRTRATYEMFRPLRLFVGYDWDYEHYYLVDREKHDDQLYYYEMRLLGGIRFDLRYVGFQVRGGYAFERFFFEGEEFSDRDFNRIDVGSGPFVMAGISFRFGNPEAMQQR